MTPSTCNSPPASSAEDACQTSSKSTQMLNIYVGASASRRGLSHVPFVSSSLSLLLFFSVNILNKLAGTDPLYLCRQMGRWMFYLLFMKQDLWMILTQVHEVQIEFTSSEYVTCLSAHTEEWKTHGIWFHM